MLAHRSYAETTVSFETLKTITIAHRLPQKVLGIQGFISK